MHFTHAQDSPAAAGFDSLTATVKLKANFREVSAFSGVKTRDVGLEQLDL